MSILDVKKRKDSTRYGNYNLPSKRFSYNSKEHKDVRTIDYIGTTKPYSNKKTRIKSISKNKQVQSNHTRNIKEVNIVITASLLISAFTILACVIVIVLPSPLNLIFIILVCAPISVCVMRIIHWERGVDINIE